MSMLVVTPCAVEFESAVSYIKTADLDYKTFEQDKLCALYISDRDIYLAMGGHGKVNFAIMAQAYIHYLGNITSLVCAGAAGGLSSDLKIYDILIAARTIEHDYKERFAPAPSPSFSICPNYLERLKKVQLKDVAIKFGAIASGDEDVIDHARARELRSDFQVEAVAWEGAGGGKVAEYFNIPYVEIRGISDLANSDAPVIFDENVAVVMPKIMQVLFAVQQLS